MHDPCGSFRRKERERLDSKRFEVTVQVAVARRSEKPHTEVENHCQHTENRQANQDDSRPGTHWAAEQPFRGEM